MALEPIGQILTRQTALRQADLDRALAEQAAQPLRERLGELLVARGMVSDREVLIALGEQWSLPTLWEIPQAQLNRELVMGLPLDFLKKQCILPLADDGVTLATADPLNVDALDAVSRVLGRPCGRALAPAGVIDDALTRCYYHEEGAQESLLDALDDDADLARVAAGGEAEDLLDVANRAPIVRLVNSIFYQAVRSRASDIHVEPYENEVKIRFRVDGVLHDRMTPPKQYVAALVSRLKIMANLNIAERRLPQDGRSRVRIGDQEVDVRVSTIPTSGGERVVLRLLDRSMGRFELSELGFSPDRERQFRRLVSMPHGIILLTGPTGSGKTTTLYGALMENQSEERNILTAEDPIEYQLPGVGQMQVNPKIGLTFANCLRHMLRQDPDVIMVGEIRDVETAEIAIHAALTGHLVFSTLHTNDSASAVTRLLDMDIEPYLVSSSLNGIMAQRLVRIICPECKAETAPGPEALALFGNGDIPVPERVYHGAGCPRCFDTGYRGRTGIFELLLVDEEIRELMMKRTGANRIKQAALKQGMRTLRDDGVRKAVAGVTTVEEVLRVTQSEIVQY